MGKKTIKLSFVLFLIIVVQHNFLGFVVGSRVLIMKNQAEPPPLPYSSLLYTINDAKDGEGDAFRPTTPGHSPGVGHQTPPNSP
ncbi:hypothetical protein AHAS_Ahas15G0023300 [Arachis hypogaea]